MKVTLEEIDRRANQEKKSLDLSFRRYNAVDMTLIVKYLRDTRTIIKLDVKYYYIGVKGAQILSTNTTLTSLIVSGNKIGTKGVQALAANTTLKVLYVPRNNIDVAGARSLAMNTSLTKLKKNLTLAHLKLNFNDQRINETIKILLIRNGIVFSYPQHAKLILVSFTEKGLFEPIHVLTPLSLSTLCCLTLIKYTENQSKQQQNNIFKECKKTIPDVVYALLTNLRLLHKDLTAALRIDLLPHYGIGESSILSKVRVSG